MDWGREIEVNGVRPAWLKGIVTVDLRTGAGWGLSDYYTSDNPAEEWAWSHDCGGPNVLAIRLPADHWAYRALDAGFEPWGGGDVAPEDWDGGEILLRYGSRARAGSGLSWLHPHMDGFGPAAGGDIIGYRKRALPAAKQPEGDTVTIRRMTERAAHLRLGEEGMMAVRALGIIRPETPAERFARETGHEVTPAVEAALAWGKAA